MNAKQNLLLGTLLACALSTASASCFIVYDKAGKIVYQGPDTPIDLSRQIHETLNSKYPEGHLVFTHDYFCYERVKNNEAPGGSDTTESQGNIQLSLTNLDIRNNGVRTFAKSTTNVDRNQLRDGFR